MTLLVIGASSDMGMSLIRRVQNNYKKKSLKQIKKLGFISEPLVISYPLKKTEECKALIEGAF